MGETLHEKYNFIFNDLALVHYLEIFLECEALYHVI